MCDNGWGAADAEVVCRQLGLPHGHVQPVGAAVFGQGTGQIWLEIVACEGSDSFLDECPSINRPWGFHFCDHSMDAGVVCTNGNYLNLQCTITVIFPNLWNNSLQSLKWFSQFMISIKFKTLSPIYVVISPIWNNFPNLENNAQKPKNNFPQFMKWCPSIYEIISPEFKIISLI